MRVMLVWMVVLCGCAAKPQAALAQENPFEEFTSAWRDDGVWHDGKAECAVYDATRTIYGVERRYQAKLFTNKEYADAKTKTKSATPGAPGGGREAFKHHLREDVPTENYTYHFSTMVYVGASDLKSLKIDMGSQEDCGATFKQFVNHKGALTWHQSSYFPNEGHRSGEYAPPAGFVYQDALSLVLRGYPFDKPRDVQVMLMPDQTTTKWSPPEAKSAVISYAGRETLDLPIGSTDAHHLKVAGHNYWFAADPKLRHIMVQYSGPGGVTNKLRSVERRAYWLR